jgi:hypothetical protein
MVWENSELSFISSLFYGAKGAKMFIDESVRQVCRSVFGQIFKRQLLGEGNVVSLNDSRGIAVQFVLPKTDASSKDTVGVFLPKHFTLVFSDVDMDMTKNEMTKRKTNAYLLSLEQGNNID